MTAESGVQPFGDRAWLVTVAGVAEAQALARSVERARDAGEAPGTIGAVVVGFENVVVHQDPGDSHADAVGPWLERSAGEAATPASPGPGSGLSSEPMAIPTTFDGPDLEEVAAAVGAPTSEVVRLLCGTALRVAFLGFSPGFPYLVGLPPALASLPRRTTPRTQVPAGSVAVAGGFAAVYPQATPGGWSLLGRTSVPLFAPDRPPFALLAAGDTVRFTVAPPTGPPPPAPGPGRPSLAAATSRFAEVIAPGLLSLVEDGGRPGTVGMGVPEAGAADPDTLRLANRLVGNSDDAAAIEVTAAGPHLRFSDPCHVAVVAPAVDGVAVEVDGRPVGANAVVPVQSGQVLAVGRVSPGLRAYLAVAGGFAVPLAVGARSSDVLCGVGPGPLRRGDRLDLGPAVRPRGVLAPDSAPVHTGPGGEVVLRVVAGPHGDGAARAALVGTRWTVGGDSNRIGLRLAADRPGPGPGLAATASTPMVTGAVQLPPDGRPIILLPDHATVGGYPVIACVISADLSRLGQLQPGDTVAFSEVGLDEARSQFRHKERMLDGRVSGWFPTRAGI